MDLKDIIKFQLQRVNPFPGLTIDVDTWQDAHNYHRDQQKLHVLAFHNTGILGGLEVVANDPPDLSVTIRPGMGIDQEGNIIIVSKAQRYNLQTREKGMIYLVIQFREVPTGPYQPPEGGQPTRIMEAYRIQERETLPTEAYLELARIDFDPADPAIRNPKTPNNPGKNEIDCRFRQVTVAGIQVQTQPLPATAPEPVKTSTVVERVATTQETITLGHIALGNAPKDLHYTGLQNLTREINRQYSFAVNLRENVVLDRRIKQCKILYLTGNGRFELSEQQQTVLGEFLKSGGTIFAEGCSEPRGETQSRGSKDFAFAFNQLAGRLKCKLENVQRGHPLLSAVHVFSGVPQGAETGMLLEGGHMIYSGSDYGCAWNGGYPDNPLTRDIIRGSVEIAVNTAIFAQMKEESSG